MKKFTKSTVLVALVAFVSVLFSCKGTGNKANEQVANDSVQVSDTLSADSVARNAEQKEENENLLDGKEELSQVIFSETGYGPIKLNGKLSKIPKEYDGLYTHYTMKEDKEMGLKNFSLYNGDDLVAVVKGFSSSNQIGTISIFSDEISVKLGNGNILRNSMKLVDAVKVSQKECYASWTGEQENPVLHFGNSVQVNTTSATFRAAKFEELKGIEGSYEDMIPVRPNDVSANEQIKCIILSYN